MLKNLLLLTILHLAICLGANAQDAPSNKDALTELVAADESGDRLLWVLASLSSAVPSGMFFQRMEINTKQLRIWGEVDGGANLAAFATNLQSLNWVERTVMMPSGAVQPASQDPGMGRSKFAITVQVKSAPNPAVIESTESMATDLPRALVAAAELDIYAAYLERALMMNGLRVDLLSAQPEEQKQYSIIRPYSLKLVGWFGGAIGFLDEIAKLPRLNSIACGSWEAWYGGLRADCRAEIHMRRVDSQPTGGRPIRKRDPSTQATIEAAKARSSDPFDPARIVALCPRPGSDRPEPAFDNVWPTESIRVAAVFDRSGGRQALIIDVPPHLHTRKVGDALGRNGGRITAIAQDEVVVVERCRGTGGQILDRNIRLPVKK